MFSYSFIFVLFQTFLEADADPGNDFLHNNSIHLHVPEGATPKVIIIFLFNDGTELLYFFHLCTL